MRYLIFKVQPLPLWVERTGPDACLYSPSRVMNIVVGCCGLLVTYSYARLSERK